MSHPVSGLRPSSVITIREDHIENHTTNYSIWRLGIQYSEKKDSSCKREKEQTNGVS